MGRRKDIDLISGFFLGMHRVSVAAYHQPYLYTLLVYKLRDIYANIKPFLRVTIK